MSPPERMRSKLGDLASTITRTPPFQDSATMPLASTSVDDHLLHAVSEGMSEMKVVIDEMMRNGDRVNAVMLQNARMTLKTISELYFALKHKEELERRLSTRSD